MWIYEFPDPTLSRRRDIYGCGTGTQSPLGTSGLKKTTIFWCAWASQRTIYEVWRIEANVFLLQIFGKFSITDFPKAFRRLRALQARF